MGRRISALFRRASQYGLLFLCAMVALFLVGSCVVLAQVFDRTRAAVGKQTDALSSVRLGQTRSELDALLSSAMDTVSLLSANNSVTGFASARSPLSAEHHYQIYNIYRSLSMLRNTFSSSKLIAEAAVYYPATDVLVTTSSRYRTRNFFTGVYAAPGDSYEALMALLQSNLPGRILPLTLEDQVTGQGELWVYAQSLDYQSTPSVHVLLFLRKESIHACIRQLEQSASGMHIFVSFGGALLNANDAPEELIQAARAQQSAPDNAPVPPGYQRTVLTSSLYRNVYYAVYYALENPVSPSQQLEQFYSTALVVFFAVVTLLLSILLGFLVPPTLRAVRELRSSGKSRGNGIVLAQQAVSQLLFRNRDTVVRLTDQWPLLKDAVLDRLTRGDSSDLSLPLCTMVFGKPLFLVALLYFAQAPESILALSQDVDRRLEGQGGAFQLDKRTLVLIFNFEAGEASGEAMVAALREALEKREGIHVNACLGSVQSGFNGVRTSYDDAVRCLDYRVIKGDNVLLPQGPHSAEDAYYVFPLDMELTLIAAVKSGDADKAYALLDLVYEENFAKRSLKPEIAQLLLSELIGTAHKMLLDMGASDASFQELLGCQTVMEIFQALQRLCRDLCKAAREYRATDSALYERCMQYVQAHYADQDFSQTKMADDLHLSPNYLSTLFKQLFGETMVNYVTRLRVEKAAELLADRSHSVFEIAVRVGFSGSDTLTRAFKRKYGVPPSLYRQSLRA